MFADTPSLPKSYRISNFNFNKSFAYIYSKAKKLITKIILLFFFFLFPVYYELEYVLKEKPFNLIDWCIMCWKTNRWKLFRNFPKKCIYNSCVNIYFIRKILILLFTFLLKCLVDNWNFCYLFPFFSKLKCFCYSMLTDPFIIYMTFLVRWFGIHWKYTRL